MKKILSGMLYSLFRGYEIWALIILVIIAGTYFDFRQLRNLTSIAVGTFGESIDLSTDLEPLIITPENIDQYRFKESGLSASDVYRFRVDPLPQDVYEEIKNSLVYGSYEEMQAVFDVLNSLHVTPAVLMIIFIPVFFGRMFSQGTIKNLLTCGYSRGMIYLSALILTVFVDFAMFLLRFLGFILLCICLQWQPPVFLPVLVPALLLSLLVLLTTTSITLAVLFISNKKTLTFIVGFLLAFSFYISISRVVYGVRMNYVAELDVGNVDTKMLVKTIQEQGQGVLEERFNYSSFMSDMYYKDKVLVSSGVSDEVPALVDLASLVILYSDPNVIQSLGDSFPPYLVTRDGLIYVSMGVNVIWIILSNVLGVFVFRKREIRS